jgi:hypothetical protein
MQVYSISFFRAIPNPQQTGCRNQVMNTILNQIMRPRHVLETHSKARETSTPYQPCYHNEFLSIKSSESDLRYTRELGRSPAKVSHWVVSKLYQPWVIAKFDPNWVLAKVDPNGVVAEVCTQ